MNKDVVSFNSGEVTPETDALSNTDKYQSGCRKLENMLPRVYGSVERRPGTTFVAEATLWYYSDGAFCNLWPYPTLQALTVAEIPTAPTEPTVTAADTAVTNSTELMAMSGSTKYYLTGNIDLTGVTWTPITGFSGVLDGRGFTISKLTISTTLSNRALFGTCASGAQIYDLTLDGCSVTSTGNGSHFSILVANMTNPASTAQTITLKDITITNSTISLTGTNFTGESVGLLAGELINQSGSSIWNCNVSGCAMVVLEHYTGGLVGDFMCRYGDTPNTVYGCSVTDTTISGAGHDFVGGMFGRFGAGYYTEACMVAHSCYTDVAISLSQGDVVGGFVGTTLMATIISCYSTGNITLNGATQEETGGFVGKTNDSLLINCYSTGDLDITCTNAKYIGGFVGAIVFDVESTNYLLRCYSTGSITIAATSLYSFDLDRIGGFSGNLALQENTGFSNAIKRCWTESDITVAVTTPDSLDEGISIGGFIGTFEYYDYGVGTEIEISNCYSWSEISLNAALADGIVGGFIAKIERTNPLLTPSPTSHIIDNCYSAQTDVSTGSSITTGLTVATTVNGFAASLVASGVATVTNSFWDNQTSAVSSSTYGDDNTTSWMKTKPNYVSAGWDFDTIWYMPCLT